MPRLFLITGLTLTSCFVAAAAEPEYPPWFDPKANVLSPEVRATLEKGDLQLLSLSPRLVSGADKKRVSKKLFHGWRILGQTPVKDPATRAELLRALEQGLAASSGVSAYCFDPRHGLSARAGDKTVDLVICFQCLRVEVWPGDGSHLLTTASPQPVFNRVLQSAGVRLPKD